MPTTGRRIQIKRAFSQEGASFCNGYNIEKELHGKHKFNCFSLETEGGVWYYFV